MTTDEKCKEILNSNLSDDLKIELIGILQNKDKQGLLGSSEKNPYWWGDERWKKLTTQPPKPIPCSGTADSGWIEQQRLNGIADAEAIIHPNVTYNP